ncbi:EpsG family protein [Buttiauxella agrestis]|uniref:EpsG family protein n=1 Tax=Buttiauxella agrestis TaxID=82977 RepID=UPI001560F0B9|nr:EpsG family protein [Buttiauxella agrestis]
MTLELLFYSVLFVTGIVSCFIENRTKVYYFITFSLFLVFSIIMRTSGFDLDINAYAVNFRLESLDIYYLKEPVFWLSSRYVYKFIHSDEVVFVLYDALSFIIVLWTTRKLNLPAYYPYLFLLFFPSLMGMENIYRQYLSMVLSSSFLAMCMLDDSFKKKMSVGLLAGLTHNVFFLFFTIYLLFNKEKKNSLVFILISIVFLFAIQFVLSTKSNSETGELGAGVYLAMSVALLGFYCVSYQFKLDDLSKKVMHLQVYFISLIVVSISLMGGGQSKRIGMFCLVLMLIPTVIAIEQNYKEKKIVRVAFFIVAILPTYIFSSSRDMLLTAIIK